MDKKWANILLVAGSGRNVGKTTFICQLLDSIKEMNPIAIKISPHFHEPTEGLKLLSEDKNYQIFEETQKDKPKDSSRYLKHGAKKSIYIQSQDEHLLEVFIALFPFLDAESPVLIESASLHKYVHGGLFLFIYNDEKETKPATKANLRIADIVIQSDGKKFTIKSNQIKFENEWKITQ